MKTIPEVWKAFLRIHHVAIGKSKDAYMSIPADPNRDADLILGDAIKELEQRRKDDNLYGHLPRCPTCGAYSGAEHLERMHQ